MKITALMITAARVAFGMYAKVGMSTPSAISTMAPETAIHNFDHNSVKISLIYIIMFL
jgi:hypothetical protein